MREFKLDPSPLAPTCPYDYAILVEEFPVGSLFCESYGAQITDRSTGEHAEVSNLTVDPARIDELMALLMRNQVSPLHLRDVIDDWL